MSASWGAMLDMLVTWVRSPMRATAVTRPAAAVRSGMPAAISEPKVISRIARAASAPTAVAGPMLKPSACSIT